MLDREMIEFNGVIFSWDRLWLRRCWKDSLILFKKISFTASIDLNYTITRSVCYKIGVTYSSIVTI